MKPAKQFPLVELAILAFAAWQSHDLINAWQHSPHDRFAWLALLVWLMPLVIQIVCGEKISASPFMMGAAIISGTLGELTELHFFGHIALALAFAAWFRISWRSLLWLAAAVAWMPVLGWWLANFSGSLVLVLRLALALVGIIFLWPKIKMQNEK